MMAEYIKRSDAMRICQQYSSHCFSTNDASGQDIADRIENDIVKLPTADVVEVVRCRDCKRKFKPLGESLFFKTEGHICSLFMIEGLSDDDFCSSGERKDDGGAKN